MEAIGSEVVGFDDDGLELWRHRMEQPQVRVMRADLDNDGWLEVRAVLWAGARLWWDETSEADTRVRSMDYSEDGAAVGCLVRWRRGRSRDDDPDAMRVFVDNNSDAAGICQHVVADMISG